jgi:hypothetical protein
VAERLSRPEKRAFRFVDFNADLFDFAEFQNLFTAPQP